MDRFSGKQSKFGSFVWTVLHKIAGTTWPQRPRVRQTTNSPLVFNREQLSYSSPCQTGFECFVLRVFLRFVRCMACGSGNEWLFSISALVRHADLQIVSRWSLCRLSCAQLRPRQPGGEATAICKGAPLLSWVVHTWVCKRGPLCTGFFLEE